MPACGRAAFDDPGSDRVRLTRARAVFQPSEETRDRDELSVLQLERLRKTVARIGAHNVG